MKIRNGNTPIQLPELIRTGDPITARWANSIRTALQRLRDRTPVALGGSSPATIYNHPFRIVAETIDDEIRAYVWNGAVTFQSWQTEDQPIYLEADITINEGALRNDPFPVLAEGYYVLSVSTDYGVWLKLGRTVALEAFNFDPSPNEPYSVLNFYGTNSQCEVIVTSDFVNKSETPTFDENNDFAYLGKISVDEDGIATITQYRKSDFVTGIVTWPAAFNIVSADDGNSITQGTDGGAYYSEPEPP
jgi:hypothetical protein